jgi:flagellar motility protein MotE (MotC chaperone)
MTSKLQSPIFGAALALVISVSLGVGLSWRVLGPWIQQAAVVPLPELPVELKQRGWDFWTIEIDNLSNELKEERAKLRKQAELQEQRAARLSAEEAELAKVRNEIEALRRDIAGKVVEINSDEAKNVRTLAQTYTNLTPRAVVAIFKEMDDATAVKILSLMKAEVVGAIFEEMSHTMGADGAPLARRAATISEKLRMMKANKTGPSS